MPLSMLAPAWGDPASHLTQRILAMTARPPRARFALASTLTVLAIALTLVACAATGTPRVEAGVAPPAPASQPKTTASAASRTPSSSRSRAPADVARSREADVRAASATTRAQTLYGLPGPGYVRVLGYSRDQMPARLFIAAGDAHFEVDRGTATVRGDTLEVTTPAVVRVVPGNSPAYRVVAEAVERGAEVEIQGTAPTGYGAPRAGSARGPAPAMIFRRDAASLATSLKADQAARGKAIQDVRAAVVAQAAARATTVDSRAAGSLEPGTIRVESMNGDRVRVRVSSTISFQARGAGIGYDRSDSSMTILTPTNITLNGSGDFAVVLEPLDAAAGIYVSARGRDGDGFVGAHAWTGGQTNDAKDAWSAIVVCSSKGTSGISGAAPGTKASMAKCE